MVGITRYGAYVPYNRLERKLLAQAFSKKVMGGEKAVASFDEDSFTLGLSAARNCLADAKDAKIGAVFFASTTAVDLEKQTASHIASVLDIEGDLRAADFSGSLRAGASAILSAIDAAKDQKNALVAVADTRLAAVDGTNEVLFGDGAAAFAFGSTGVIAEYVGSHSVSYDFYDTWRTTGEDYPHFFDEKYAVEMGYVPFVVESVKGVLDKTGTKPEQISKVIIDGANLRFSGQVLVAAGFKPTQAQQESITAFGYSGAAYAPTQLAFALEAANQGDLILYVSYGEGSDAILFKATAGCEKIGAGRGFAHYQNYKNNTLKYEMLLKWKKMTDFEPPRRVAIPRSSMSDFYRKRKKNLALYGSICTECNTPHYPPCRVCVSCKAMDKMVSYKFQEKKATLATFTFDYVAFSEDSPNAVAVVDFEGGGRLFTQIMDCDKDKLKIGMSVEMVYRKLFCADGINTYSWKCVPAVENL